MSEENENGATERRVLIVGSGPAGISTALWLSELEVPFRWVTADASIGGTLQRVGNPIRTYAGVPATGGGAELIAAFQQQLAEQDLSPEWRVTVDGVEPASDAPVRVHITDSSGARTTERFAAVVLATGTRPRLLGLPREAELLGAGVEISVTHTRSRYNGLDVAIVGGGDAALEGALLLAEVCPRIYLIHRGREFRAQRRFVDAVEREPRVEPILESEVATLRTDENSALRGIQLRSGRELAIRGMFVRIGVEPAIPGGFPRSGLDEDGYVATSPAGRTAIAGVYAVGDVTGRAHQSVAWAVGTGAHAATALQAEFGRSATGVSRGSTGSRE